MEIQRTWILKNGPRCILTTTSSPKCFASESLSSPPSVAVLALLSQPPKASMTTEISGLWSTTFLKTIWRYLHLEAALFWNLFSRNFRSLNSLEISFTKKADFAQEISPVSTCLTPGLCFYRIGKNSADTKLHPATSSRKLEFKALRFTSHFLRGNGMNKKKWEHYRFYTQMFLIISITFHINISIIIHLFCSYIFPHAWHSIFGFMTIFSHSESFSNPATCLGLHKLYL